MRLVLFIVEVLVVVAAAFSVGDTIVHRIVRRFW